MQELQSWHGSLEMLPLYFVVKLRWAFPKDLANVEYHSLF